MHTLTPMGNAPRKTAAVPPVRTALAAALAALVLSACTALIPFASRQETPYGNYLAGYHAGTLHETRQAAKFISQAIALDPDNPLLLRRAVNLELSGGNINRAATFARQLVSLGDSPGYDNDNDNDNAALAQFTLGLRQMRNGNNGRALRHLNAISANSWVADAASLAAAWTLHAEGDTDAAIKRFYRLSDNQSLSLPQALQMTVILEDSGQVDAAHQFHQKTLEVSHRRGALAYGAFLERQGFTDEAVEIYAFASQLPADFVLTDHPFVRDALRRIDESIPPPALPTPAAAVSDGLTDTALTQANIGRNDRAIILARLALFMQPDNQRAKFVLAGQYERQQQYDDAITAWRTIPENTPLFFDAQLRIAIALDDMDETDVAIWLLTGLARQFPDQIQPFMTLGEIYQEHDQLEDALGEYSNAIDMVSEPEQRHWNLFYARGTVHERLGQWDAAEKDLQKAIDLSGGHPLALNYLGYSWADNGHNLQQAFSMIQQAVDKRPGQGFIIDSLGWVHYRLGNFPDAVDYLEQAVELQPGDPIINDHLGDAFWQVNRRIEARFQWHRALDLNPEPEHAIAIRNKLILGPSGHHAAIDDS